MLASVLKVRQFLPAYLTLSLRQLVACVQETGSRPATLFAHNRVDGLYLWVTRRGFWPAQVVATTMLLPVPGGAAVFHEYALYPVSLH